jgi:hypothetical protein
VASGRHDHCSLLRRGDRLVCHVLAHPLASHSTLARCWFQKTPVLFLLRHLPLCDRYGVCGVQRADDTAGLYQQSFIPRRYVQVDCICISYLCFIMGTGPSAYEEATSSPPLNAAFVLSSWCADLLMVSVHLYLSISLLTTHHHKIWRCVVVYRDTKVHRVIFGLGCFMFFAAVGLCQTYLFRSPPS